MSCGGLLYADHDAWPRRAGVRGLVTADLTLAAVLARCGAAGDFTSDDALAAVAALAHQTAALGHPPARVATIVRRSLAAAAPASMTVVAFETVARTLVRHALHGRAADVPLPARDVALGHV